MAEYPVSTAYGLALGNTDPNWTCVDPNGRSTSTVVKTDDQYWIQFSKWANWISPTTPSNGVNPIGLYTYTTTFELDAFDPAKYMLAANVVSDDLLQSISVNGKTVPPAQPCYTTNYLNCTTRYDFSGSFVTGKNTLKFVVNNIDTKDSNPTGLYVEFVI